MMLDENGAVEHEVVHDPLGDAVLTWQAGGVAADSLPRQQFTGQENDGDGVDTVRTHRYLGITHIAATEGTVDGSVYLETGFLFLHADQVGSVTAIVGATGDLLWSGEFLPFGEIADPVNQSEWGWVFGGKGYDEAVGLYYFNARWYDATTGMITDEAVPRPGLIKEDS